MRLALDDCLAGAREAIELAVRVELKDVVLDAEPPAGEDPRTVAVRIECAAGGVSAGVVLIVAPRHAARRYRYALDWSTQPIDARPRLIGLAVAEAVDASQIELVAVPEPPASIAGAALAPSVWAVAVFGTTRSFSSARGINFLGVGVMPVLRLSRAARLVADVVAEADTVFADTGIITARSLSCAPRFAYRTDSRPYVEVGAGGRFGVVQLRGEARDSSLFTGRQLVRAWLGPAVTAAVGIALTPAVSLSAGAEAGVVAVGAVARDFGAPVAAVDGTWLSLSAAVTISL